MTPPSTSSYRHVLRDLLARIVDGEFAAGTALPSETKLAEHYGVARGTVRNALSGLADRGMVMPVQGTGWIVQSTLHTQSFVELRSFAQWARSKGVTPGGLVHATDAGQASALEARKLRVALRSSVVRVTRTRTLDGRIVMLERTTYPEWMANHIVAIPADEASVVDAMQRRFGITTAHADYAIDTVPASSADAVFLDVRRSSPLLRVRRTSFTSGGRPIEFGEDRYLPDTVTFQVQASSVSNTLTRSEFSAS
ncbi:GntR family transcriptional regulator [Microbacterium esteraromaticum]|uniref:GntR family transcriptional regulator n=1 Tax=Microbacterium esteraromaticum TaxID=57043 RepID=UPI001CD5BD41|nr:GntR family transcriptional regulator [Microbacterium esteraromaticum]MCA1307702.1 GntR family transcriptional regulator [Microbacterium esteraromaticum]